MGKLKICHVTNSHADSIPRILRECESAIRNDMSPYIVLQGNSFEKDGISYVGVKLYKSRLYRMIFTSKDLYKEAVKVDADIYQLHDPELLLYAIMLKKKGKVVIFDSHEFYGVQIEIKEYIPLGIRKLIAKAYRSFETWVCKKIDAVIAVCTIDGEDYFSNRTNKTVFVANLPDTTIFSKETHIDRTKLNAVVYVGSLSHSRGITHLVKAVAKTKAKLILCGPFSSIEYYEELQKMPEFSNVEYKGIVPRDKIVSILNTSSIGVSTLLHVGQYSRIDTLPTKVYEYMSVGLPVIITDTSYAKKAVDKYKFGICVDPEDIEEIADKINYLIDNPEIAHQMGENGRKTIKEKYNWKVEETKLIDLYKELVVK